jgi:hypothetical protein
LYHEDGGAEVHAAELAEAIEEDSMLWLFDVTARGKNGPSNGLQDAADEGAR